MRARATLCCVVALAACSRPPARGDGGSIVDRSPQAQAGAPAPRSAAMTDDAGASPMDRRQLADVAAHLPRTDLAAVTTPALAAALQDPERLWAFLLAPETPYLERRAAGVQGRKSFPIARLDRLMSALGQLRTEERRSHWGLEAHPLAGVPFLPSPPAATGEVTVLGHPWRAPERLADYPLTWEEEAAAPWPWQVEVTLERLLDDLVPTGNVAGHTSAAYGEAWLAACLTLPWSTDEEALLFVEASRDSTHLKTPAILARWRSIALDARFPEAAARVAGELGEATRLWDAPESQSIGQVLTLDILERSPHVAARHNAAYGLHFLSQRVHEGKDVPMPPPASAILASLRAALDPRNGDVWTRLYVYGFGALGAMATPPFRANPTMDPNGPEPRARMNELAAWFRTNEPRLAAEAAREKPQLDEARALLARFP